MHAATAEHDDGGRLRAEARTWLAEHHRPAIPAAEWLALVVDGGWAAPSWPTEWFGKGAAPDAARVVDDEFRKVGASGFGQDVSNLWANTILRLRAGRPEASDAASSTAGQDRHVPALQ